MTDRSARQPRGHLDWHPPAIPWPVFLQAQRVALREWSPSDEKVVHSYALDPEVGRYLVRGPAELLAEPALAIREGKREQRTDYALAIVDDTGGDVIGAGELHVDSIRHHRGEVGYILRRETWGRGLATEVAGLLLRFGFDELRLHRLWATCDPANAASIRVLEKVGMRREGLLGEHYLAHDGTWRDAVVYAAIRDSTKG